MNNMELWNRVSKTDKKYIKKGYKGKDYLFSINPQYQRKLATEIFGPIGEGWGVSDLRVEIAGEILVYTATLWYIYQPAGSTLINAKKGKFAIASDWNLGPDCVKSARTDAITKGLSELGFNADIFLGELDVVDAYFTNKESEEGAATSQPQVSQDRADDEWRSQPIGYGKKYKDLTWDMLADQDLQYLQWMAQKAEKISDDKKQKALHMLSLKPLEDRYGRS